MAVVRALDGLRRLLKMGESVAVGVSVGQRWLVAALTGVR